MKQILSLIICFTTFSAFGCEEIYGNYKSVSETHWNFELDLQKDNAILTYTNYFYGQHDTRTDEVIKSLGHCKKTKSGYKLIFAQMSVEIEFHGTLSHSYFGGNGASPGVKGEFIKGQTIKLWQGM